MVSILSVGRDQDCDLRFLTLSDLDEIGRSYPSLIVELSTLFKKRRRHSSELHSAASAAVRIQRCFRGFVVRKKMGRASRPITDLCATVVEEGDEEEEESEEEEEEEESEEEAGEDDTGGSSSLLLPPLQVKTPTPAATAAAAVASAAASTALAAGPVSPASDISQLGAGATTAQVGALETRLTGVETKMSQMDGTLNEILAQLRRMAVMQKTMSLPPKVKT